MFLSSLRAAKLNVISHVTIASAFVRFCSFYFSIWCFGIFTFFLIFPLISLRSHTCLCFKRKRFNTMYSRGRTDVTTGDCRPASKRVRWSSSRNFRIEFERTLIFTRVHHEREREREFTVLLSLFLHISFHFSVKCTRKRNLGRKGPRALSCVSRVTQSANIIEEPT